MNYTKLIEQYKELLRQLLDLQQKLIQAFEAEVELIPLSSDFIDAFGSELNDIVKDGRSISQIVQAWPSQISGLSLLLFVKPRKGVIQLDEQNWLYNIHGSTQVSFISLPSGLDEEVLEQIRKGKTDALIDLPNGGLDVEIQYLKEGRTDCVSAWSVWVFANSVGSNMGNLSLLEHENLLEKLAREGFLTRLPQTSIDEGRYFVLTMEPT
jgi:hypothetical protein